MTNSTPLCRILVVGGSSRAAQVFRRRVAQPSEFSVVTLTRKPIPAFDGETVTLVDDYFSPPVDVLHDIDAVVNFAGITGRRTREAFNEVNVAGPLRLAERAKQAGIGQFVQLSSFSIYGHAQLIGPQTPEAPVSEYGRSKQAADHSLSDIADTDFTVTLLRAPMLYGPHVGTKLRRLVRLISIVPILPIPRPANRRAALHLENLASAVLTVIRHRLPGIRFAADPDCLTLEAIAQSVFEVTGRRVRLLRLPATFFWPMRRIAPSIYFSLYANSVARTSDCLDLREFGGLSLQDGLKDIVSAERKVR